MDEDELLKDYKQSQKKHEAPKPAAALPVHKNEPQEYDFINMKADLLATCLPMRTEVPPSINNSSFAHKTLREKKQTITSCLTFPLQSRYQRPTVTRISSPSAHSKIGSRFPLNFRTLPTYIIHY